MQTYESQLNGDLNWALMEGGMHFDGTNAVHRTLRRLVERFDELDIDYAIAGGMALFFHGYRRFTEVVEVLVTAEGLAEIHAALDGLGYVRPFENSKNLRDTVTGVKIVFLITGQYPGDGKPGPIAFPDPADVCQSIEGTNFVVLPRLVELKLASGKASHRSRDLADVQAVIQVLHLTADFANELNSDVRDLYLAKWKDAQQALKEDY